MMPARGRAVRWSDTPARRSTNVVDATQNSFDNIVSA
jgi:hypothetical protein